MITVDIIPILKDNYAYVLCARDGACAIVDPGEAEPIIEFLDSKKLRPEFILNTHHHGDHVAGNQAIKQKYKCKILAPAKESAKITDVDQELQAGEIFNLSTEKCFVLAAEGHTAGGVLYHFPESMILFTGDTLFSLGCGRLFEGTAAQMYTAMQTISALPDETKIYCGHEYTLANGKFAQSIEPDNKDIILRIAEAKALRDKGLPTLPTTIRQERKTNVFLKAKSAEEFAALRLQKDLY